MKLIALKDFANNFGIEDGKLSHPRHIHKGHQFEIGTAKELKLLSAQEKMLVAQLNVAGCVGDATDAKVVAAVKEDLAIDQKREENAAKLNRAADASNLAATLTDLLKKAAVAAAPATAGEK